MSDDGRQHIVRFTGEPTVSPEWPGAIGDHWRCTCGAEGGAVLFEGDSLICPNCGAIGGAS